MCQDALHVMLQVQGGLVHCFDLLSIAVAAVPRCWVHWQQSRWQAFRCTVSQCCSTQFDRLPNAKPGRHIRAGQAFMLP